jgi:methionyl-tRNA formyltransferase
MIKDEHFEVVGVVSQPDRPSGRKLQLTPSPVKALVAPLGIPVITPESVNRSEALEAIASWKAEVAVVVAFGQILSQKFLDLFPQKVVNVHASLLPKWRGAAPVQRALMAGDEVTGVSLQVMVKKLDAGPVLGSRKIPVPSEMDAIELFEKVTVLGADLIAVELMDYLRGNLTPEPQDPEMATFAPKIEKSEAAIDWRASALQIQNQIRGLAAGPVAFTRRDKKITKIHKARLSQLHLKGHPGDLVQTDSGLHVVCGQGAIEIVKIQPESRSAMNVAEYLRGYALEPNAKFESIVKTSSPVSRRA